MIPGTRMSTRLAVAPPTSVGSGLLDENTLGYLHTLDTIDTPGLLYELVAAFMAANPVSGTEYLTADHLGSTRSMERRATEQVMDLEARIGVLGTLATDSEFEIDRYLRPGETVSASTGTILRTNTLLIAFWAPTRYIHSKRHTRHQRKRCA